VGRELLQLAGVQVCGVALGGRGVTEHWVDVKDAAPLPFEGADQQV
jgi:hypothetical protein